ncbi:MAG: CcmD family protein [Bacteroidetes bacterium]|nr:CcmD family protein [Bacteroidota bacterium]
MEIKDIHIVAIVLLLIFAGIAFYLITLDKRISKIENAQKPKLQEEKK